jgi:hypothetical protein
MVERFNATVNDLSSIASERRATLPPLVET